MTEAGQRRDVGPIHLLALGINGIVGGTDGKAEATANGSSAYKITGTAVVSDPAHPGQSQSLPFTIEAPC